MDSNRFAGVVVRGIVSTIFLIGLLTASFLSAVAPNADQWSKFRGPEAQGERGENPLPSTEFGLSVAWQQPLGSGYSQISIADGRVFTQFTSGDVDVVGAFDMASGRELWRHTLDKKYVGHDGSEDGPLATPTIVDGLVYAVGPNGQVVALDAVSGRRRWSFTLDEKNSTLPLYGYTTSPLVVGDSLILATGGQGHAITALDRFTGEPKWGAGDDAVDYQTPSLVEVAGRTVLVAVTNQLIYGVDVETGQTLWQSRHSEGSQTEGSAHVVPIGEGRFLVNYDRGAKLYQASSSEVEVVWESRAFGNSLSIPVRVGDYFYGYTGGVLTCARVSTGEIVWRSRKPGGQGISRVGDALAILAPDGNLVLVDPSPDGYRELTRVKVLEAGSTHFPSYADGRFFVRNMDYLAAVKVDTGLKPTVGAVEVTEVLKGAFGRWIGSLRNLPTADRQAAVDRRFSDLEVTPLFEDGGMVHFVWRGEAEDVALGGDPVGGPAVSLVQVEGTDLFFTSTELLSTAQYSYTLSVDFGPPGPDPGNPYVADQGFVTFSDLRMPEWPASPHLDEPEPGAPRGTLDSFQFKSEILGNARQIQMWRPADYGADPERRYPLLVVNHGDNQVRGALMTRTLDNMVGKSVEPLVVVFVPRFEASEYGGAKADNFNRFLVEELLPHLDQHYRTDGQNRAIMGPGSAGVASLYAALRFPAVFSKVAVQSFYPVEPVHGQFAELLSADGEKPSDVFVVYSNQDYVLANNVLAMDASKELLGRLREASIATSEMVTDYTAGWAGWRGQHDDILLHFFPLEGD